MIATIVAAATLGTVANASTADKGKFGFSAGIQTGSNVGFVMGASYGIGQGKATLSAGTGRATNNGAHVDTHSVELGYEMSGYTVGYRVDETNANDGATNKITDDSLMVGFTTKINPDSRNTLSCQTNLYTKQKVGNADDKTKDALQMGICTLSHSFMG